MNTKLDSDRNKKIAFFLINKIFPLASKYGISISELTKYVSMDFTVYWVNYYIEKGFSLGSKFATAPWEIALENKVYFK